MREWFYRGSKIILTTRNVDLLNARKHCKRYAVDTMNFSNSLELFSWHAFGYSHPPECYIEHSEKIAKQCQGLPLALEVLGASLHGKKVDVWRSAIQKLEIFTHSKIQKILGISYESLPDDHDRDLFLELACFFNGEAKSSVVMILDKCDYFTTVGIENLIDRCLLKIDRYGKLRMHQLIQSMGREIVRLQSSKDPEKRSRLWHYRDFLKILEDETGTGAIEGLALDMGMCDAYPTELKTEAFSMMRKLKLLKLNKVQLGGDYKEFPKRLKWLCWQGYTLRSLPNDFPLSSLVAIDMQSSKLQKLVQGNARLRSLKLLNLSHCHCIVESPDFSQMNALEQLILEGCESLVEIDESIQNSEGLMLLNLRYCKSLIKLPKNVGMLKLLDTLIISGCSSLSMLPAEMRNLESLKVFLADGLDFGNTSFATQDDVSWRVLIWGWVSKQKIGSRLLLSSLPCKSIRRLSLVNCNLHDTAFPKDFMVLPSLRYLDLSKNPIRFLPDCFKGVESLRRLTIYDCNHLQAIENLPNINSLHVGYCPLLEKIRCKRGTSLITFSYPSKCDKLLEMEKTFKVVPLEKVDLEMINNCGIDDAESKKRIQMRLYNNYTGTETRCPIQGIYENQRRGKTFSIFYPGSSVPIRFTNQRSGPSTSFMVSSHSKLRYLNTCIVYKFLPGSVVALYMIIANKTKNRMMIYAPSCNGIPEGDEYMTWLSHWKFGSHEVGPGDEVNIFVFNWHYNTSFEVKEVGIHLVYDEQEQAGDHPSQQQKIQQNYDETSQFVIPVELQAKTHCGTTQLYFLGSNLVRTDCLLESIFRRICFGCGRRICTRCGRKLVRRALQS